MTQKIISCVAAVTIWLSLFIGADSFASFTVPERLDAEILNEDSPTAWKPSRIGIEQFEPVWRGQPIEGVSLELGAKSFDWVRIMDVLVLPRAQWIARAKDIEGGVVSISGASQELERAPDGSWTAAIPIALMGDSGRNVEIQVTRGGKVLKSNAGLRFSSRGLPREDLFATDTTCSRFGVKAVDNHLDSGKTWIMAGCRYIYTEGAAYRVSTLEIYLHWEGAGDEIRMNGHPLKAIRPGLWLLRLRSEPGSVEVEAGGDRLRLEYFIPEHAHYLRFAGGIGPYAFNFTGNGENVSTVTLMPSIYGSYFFSEDIQITTFATAMLESHWLSSWGVYLRSRSFRFLDRRFAISLNVGGQFVGFSSLGQYQFILRFPQGSELTWTDAFGKGRDLVLGGFYYPMINGVSYSEIWLRVTQGRLFGELNFMEWNQTAQLNGNSAPTSFYSRSVGLSVGVPLGGML